MNQSEIGVMYDFGRVVYSAVLTILRRALDPAVAAPVGIK